MDAAPAELEAALDRAKTPRERVDALNALAWPLRLEDSARCHRLATEARDIARAEGYVLGQARATRMLAMSISDLERLPEVFPLAEEAKELFDQAGDPAGCAAARDFLASLYEFIGDYAGGLDLALEALSIARELDDPVRQGYALSSVGGILAASGQVDSGIARLEEALRLFQECGDELGMQTIRSRLAKVLTQTDRREEAAAYARQCIEAGESSGDEWLLASSYAVLAKIARDEDRCADAEQLYRKGLDSARTQPVRSVMGSEVAVAFARFLLEQGRLEEAREAGLDALERIEGPRVSVINEHLAHSVVAEVEEALGNYPQALHHLREARDLRQQMEQRDARNKLAQVEARAAIDAAKKDAEIHRLKYVELHTMQAKLVEAEKIAFLGRLAAGTAHELNTPLAVLRSNQALLDAAVSKLTASGEGVSERIASVLASAESSSHAALERIGKVAESFKRFTALDQAERRSFNLCDAIESALAVLHPKPGVTIVRDLHNVPELTGWPREINHAFLTVLQNAVQSIEDTGEVRVQTNSTGEEVQVRVVDTGGGMSKDQLETLFDVGWSVEGGRKKMRLGLSAARAAMERHGGMVSVDSAPGKGTAVTFTFPLDR